jgi:hypothetical protein
MVWPGVIEGWHIGINRLCVSLRHDAILSLRCCCVTVPINVHRCGEFSGELCVNRLVQYY